MWTDEDQCDVCSSHGRINMTGILGERRGGSRRFGWVQGVRSTRGGSKRARPPPQKKNDFCLNGVFWWFFENLVGQFALASPIQVLGRSSLSPRDLCLWSQSHAGFYSAAQHAYLAVCRESCNLLLQKYYRWANCVRRSGPVDMRSAGFINIVKSESPKRGCRFCSCGGF